MIDPRAYSMSENTLQEHVRSLCRELGLDVQHIHDSRRCWLPGWPDLFILGPRGALARELKAERDPRPSPDQRRVGGKLICAGIDWAVWLPRDLFSGVIADQLDRIAHAPKETAWNSQP